MKTSLHSQAIVLRRTNYGEADRIVTFLTKDYGKISAIAKGVRKERSKQAGGIEPLCVSIIGFTQSNKELCILTSARLQKNYSDIMGDYTRLEFVYSCLKETNKITETVTDPVFFNLIELLFLALQNNEVLLEVTTLWWYVQLAEATGHGVNVEQAGQGKAFDEHSAYTFDIQNDYFVQSTSGKFRAEHIKFIRFAKSHTPAFLCNIKNCQLLATDLLPMLSAFVESR